MAHVLCMRLFGPLASWGSPEVGITRRPSQRHPTRGAILGILAAAHGLAPQDHELNRKLGEGLSIAVASHGPRRMVEEFRTSQSGFQGRGSEVMTRRERISREAGSTELTTRQSVEDGLWRVFLAQRPEGEPLTNHAEALKKPAFDLFLGRKEHPMALPLGPRLVEGDLMDALCSYLPVPATLEGEVSQLHAFYDALRRRIAKPSEGFELRCDQDFPGAPIDGLRRQVSDDPFNRVAWTFRTRTEIVKRMEAPPEVQIPVRTEQDLVSEFFAP